MAFIPILHFFTRAVSPLITQENGLNTTYWPKKKGLRPVPHPFLILIGLLTLLVCQDAGSKPGLLAGLKRILPDCLAGSHTKPLAFFERKRLFRMHLDRGNDYVRGL